MNQCFLRRIPGRTLEARREGSFLIRAGALCLGNGVGAGGFVWLCMSWACAAFLLRFSPAGRILWVLSAVLTAAPLMARRVWTA